MSDQNKMGTISVNRLIWSMGLPMVLSMVLQAVYNVVDTVFVINSSAATQGNAALTAAFPIQILMIAAGVGTGVGINALLSRKLGEGDSETAGRIAGNGIFLAAVIFAFFFVFGLFGAESYMKLMSGDKTVIKMGTDYLRICCCLSFGAIGFTVYERFLQASGRTVHTMAAQIAGAVTNMILDYVFVILLDGGTDGAAYATVIGQVISFAAAALFHYFLNKEIKNGGKYLMPNIQIIKAIYKIGIPAAIMQALLAGMMFMTLQIFRIIDDSGIRALMINSFGIYYKIMQTALFACFGMSNTLITLVSFNSGMGNKERLAKVIRFGLINTVIVSVVIMALYEIFCTQTAGLFGLSLPDITPDGIEREDILSICRRAIRISSLGYAFMGISIAVQGIFQGLRYVYRPIVISLLRLIIFVIPFSVIFCIFGDTQENFWWTFVISEFLTSVISILMLRRLDVPKI